MSASSRTRPGTNSRWVDSQAWILKPTLDDGVPGWLGGEWMDAMNLKEGRDEDDYSRLPSIIEI